MRRQLEQSIKSDLERKIVLLSGPRQTGKTTLAKSLYASNYEYFNMDSQEHRLLIKKSAWRRDCDLVILDELHKIKNWKTWLKGVYDTNGIPPRLIVTGSARLDTYRKGGDSMAGRFFSYRLHPFSVAELKHEFQADEALDRILSVGGFPEPFINGSPAYAKRWQRSHVDRILRDDIFDIAAIKDIRAIETLVELLRACVTSPVSYESLSRDLQVSPHTVKHWVSILESLYIIFVVTPYSHNIARSILKQPKIYFYDTAFVNGDAGARYENAVACALLKRQHFLEDTTGEKCALHYLRDKQKREVDFLTVRESKAELLVEAKLTQTETAHLKHFAAASKHKPLPICLVKNLDRELFIDGVHLKKAAPWLQKLEA